MQSRKPKNPVKTSVKHERNKNYKKTGKQRDNMMTISIIAVFWDKNIIEK